MRKLLFLCISIFLIFSVYEICASVKNHEDCDGNNPSWLSDKNDQKSTLPSDNHWWSNFFRPENKQDGLHCVSSSSELDNVKKQDKQIVEKIIDCTDVKKMQHKISNYIDHDTTLSELHQQAKSYVNKVEIISSLANVDNSLHEFGLLRTTMEQINQHVDTMIAHKNIDYIWQMKKYGMIQGSLLYIKNLCMPRNMYSYIGAGLSGISAFIMLQQKSASNITINVPAGAQFNLGNCQSTTQDIAKTAVACSLVAGTTVAAMQWYISWMYRENSKKELASWIEMLQNRNNNMASYVIMNNVKNTTERAELKLDSLIDNTNQNHQTTQSQFVNVRSDIIQISTKLDDNHKINQNEFEKLQQQHQTTKNYIGSVIQALKEENQHQLNSIDGKLENITSVLKKSQSPSPVFYQFLNNNAGSFK